MPNTPIQLDQQALAEYLGVRPETITRYRVAERQARYPFPEPDGKMGRTSWWWSTTIDAWLKTRPGMGAPGRARPRKDVETS